jgi:hypothetical protein
VACPKRSFKYYFNKTQFVSKTDYCSELPIKGMGINNKSIDLIGD